MASLIGYILSQNDERAIASQVYQFHLSLTDVASGRRTIPLNPLVFGLVQAVAYASNINQRFLSGERFWRNEIGCKETVTKPERIIK